MRSISERLRRLEIEANKGSIFPEFTLILDNGDKVHWTGLDVISRCAEGDVRRVVFDGSHQPSVDGGALVKAMYGSDGIEVLPMR